MRPGPSPAGRSAPPPIGTTEFLELALGLLKSRFTHFGIGFRAKAPKGDDARGTYTFAAAARCESRRAPADLGDRGARRLERHGRGRRRERHCGAPGAAWPRRARS